MPDLQPFSGTSPTPARATAAFAAPGGAGVAGVAGVAGRLLGVLALAACATAAGALSPAGDLRSATAGKPAGLAAAPGGAVRPSKDALHLAEEVRARWMGIDHAGNLWAWEPLEGTVRSFSPAGEKVGTVLVPLGVVAVDGDAQWGAVALTQPPLPPAVDPAKPDAPLPPADNGKLVWVRPGAAPGSHDELDLPATMGWVCWIDQDTVALSPQRTTARVELWSLKEHRLLLRFGSEEEIKLTTGMTRVREVVLRYDPARRLLYSLESYTGVLQVHTLEGKLAWHAKLNDPYREVEQRTLADLDDRAKGREMALGRAASDLWMAVGPDGSAWVSQQIDMLHTKVHLAKVTATGTTAEVVSDLRCPSRTFTIWGGELVFFRDISTPREVCNSVAPLP